MKQTPHKLCIRSYYHDDEPAVVDLWKACNLIVPHNNPYKDIQRKLKVNPEWFLVGVLNIRLIASCMVGYEGHRGWINYLAVHPEIQRNGYARDMMNEAEKILREAGCPKMSLQIRATNKQVVEFYKQLGFVEDNVVSMGKRLEVDHLI